MGLGRVLCVPKKVDVEETSSARLSGPDGEYRYELVTSTIRFFRDALYQSQTSADWKMAPLFQAKHHQRRSRSLSQMFLGFHFLPASTAHVPYMSHLAVFGLPSKWPMPGQMFCGGLRDMY